VPVLNEIALRVAAATAEPLSDALLAAGALAVTLEDAQADTEQEAPLYGEPGSEPEQQAWPHSRLLVLVAPGTDPGQLLAAAAAACSVEAPTIDGSRSVADADWVRLTQSQFLPTQVGARLWIVPSWHQPPDATALNIRIDPGVAFGTGTHPTTHLCLAWLDGHLRGGERVLDYGCGSGILAIAAARLGAAAVVGVDIDAQALLSARANSLANGVDELRARYTDPSALAPASEAAGRFDLVLANILANPLKLLAPALLARVAPGGALVLAGLLDRQAEEMCALYRQLDARVRLTAWARRDGWVCLAGHRSV
jgi:ribosomal protein L11 methyltransferase